MEDSRQSTANEPNNRNLIRQANNSSKEQLETQMQRQFKSLNSALLVNHEKLIKYHSQNVVILNRKIQEKIDKK